MDDGGQCENGRHKADQYKPPQGQWLVQPQPSMKQIMGLMAERDAAIHEKNMALSERKAAFAERDMAFLQRDSAIAERNNAILERDNAIATLQYQENSISCPPGFQLSHGTKHMHQQQQHLAQVNEAQYNSREMQICEEDIPMSPVPSDDPKPGRGRGKQPKQVKATPANKKRSQSPRKIKRETEDIKNGMFEKTQEWMNEHGMTGGIDDQKKKVLVKSDWKSQDLGVNQIAFDETTMPPPGCSCTGAFRQCYKWGNGGWQSACCTTSISTYPLPAVPNKRHARVGGRKMSGSAFSKLLTRLAAEGRDLSTPVDLKDHWAKHGTNRYITIR